MCWIILIVCTTCCARVYRENFHLLVWNVVASRNIRPPKPRRQTVRSARRPTTSPVCVCGWSRLARRRKRSSTNDDGGFVSGLTVGVPLVSRTVVHRVADRLLHRMVLRAVAAVRSLRWAGEGNLRVDAQTSPAATHIRRIHDPDEGLRQLSDLLQRCEGDGHSPSSAWTILSSHHCYYVVVDCRSH